MLGAIGLMLLLVAQAAPNQEKGFIPTSDVVDVARMVAEGLGYSLADRTKYFFDIIPGEKGAPLFPGYVTIGFYWNSNTVDAISINVDTGQVLDISACKVFEYPRIKQFGRTVRQGSGAAPFSMEELQRQTGCESLKRLSVRRPRP